VVGALKATHGGATISYDTNARPTLMGEPEDARKRVEEIVVLSDVVKASDEGSFEIRCCRMLVEHDHPA
jgi:fructokinase